MSEQQLQQIPVDTIVEASDNLRRDVGDITELAQSVEALGIIEPLIVTTEPGGYLLVAGARRLAAARKVGLQTVPAIVRTLLEQERVAIMLIENLQRHDLAPLEEADGYSRLVALGNTQQQVAEAVGRSQSHVAKRISLLKLPEVALEGIAKGSIKLEDAFALTRLSKEPQRIERIIKESRKERWREISEMVDDEERQIRIDQKRAPVIEKLKARGITVLEQMDLRYSGVARYLSERDYPRLEQPIETKVHAKEPCHAALVDATAKIRYVCTQPTRHKAKGDGAKPGKSKAEREKARKLKEKAEELSAAWAEATSRRIEFMRSLLTGKPGLGLAVEATAAALTNPYSSFELMAGERFNELLGLDEKKSAFKIGSELVAEHGETKIVLATALSALEQELTTSSYSKEAIPRGDGAVHALEWLKAHGYALSEVEQLVLEQKRRRA